MKHLQAERWNRPNPEWMDRMEYQKVVQSQSKAPSAFTPREEAEQKAEAQSPTLH